MENDRNNGDRKTMKRSAILQVDNLEITGQFFLPDHATAPYPAVCLCHGIPSGIIDPSDGGYPALAERLAGEGFATLSFNFRGSGTSEGNFDIAGWTHDARAAIDYLWQAREVDRKHLFMVGFSAGAAVAIYVATADRRVSGVVACASPADFSTISESGQPQASLDYFRKIGIIRDSGFPSSIAEWTQGFREVNAAKVISRIAPRPILIVHGKKDTVVPLSSGQKLFEMASEPRQIIVLDNAEHRLRRDEKAVSIVIEWLKLQTWKKKAAIAVMKLQIKINKRNRK
jgi:uncharacterized protein